MQLGDNVRDQIRGDRLCECLSNDPTICVRGLVPNFQSYPLPGDISFAGCCLCVVKIFVFPALRTIRTCWRLFHFGRVWPQQNILQSSTKIIRRFYHNQTGVVRNGTFDILAGVGQNCVLSSRLFLVALELADVRIKICKSTLSGKLRKRYGFFCNTSALRMIFSYFRLHGIATLRLCNTSEAADSC